jgi:hypothetical protein
MIRHLRSRRAERGTIGVLRARRAPATAVVVVLVALVAAGAAAQQPLAQAAGPKLTFFVAPPGSVGGRCSDGRTLLQARSVRTPWCSVDKAAAAAPAGATVYVRGGKYEHFTTKNKCRTGWVTYKPYPHETVTIDGANGGTDDRDGAWQLTNDCYIHIKGFNMTDRFYLEANQSHIDIDGNYVHSKDPHPNVKSGSANVTVSGVATLCRGPKCSSGQTDLMIRNNHFQGISYNCLGTGSNPNACDTNDNDPWGYGYCIRPDSLARNVVITKNRIDGCWEDAIQGVGSGTLISLNNITNVCCGASGHQDGIQIFRSSSNTTIIRNNFHGNESTCMRIQNGVQSHFTIVDNVCAGNVTGRCMDLEDFHDSLIAYNTCGLTRYGSDLEDDPGVPGSPSGIVVENNIFGDAIKGRSMTVEPSVRNNFTYRYNIRTEPTPDGCSPGCISGRQPRFMNAQNGADMRLRPDSVGIDAGIADSVKSDMQGHSRAIDYPRRRNRGSGARPYSDMGAYELAKPKKKKKKG